MCLPYIKVVIVSIMHELVLKREFYCFFLSVFLDNSKSIKRKEVSKAADKGVTSKRRASIDSTPPTTQDDFQDNTCIDTQQSCVYDEHVSPSAASPVLPLTWHCYMWLHVMYDVYCIASNFVEFHLLTLHIILVNKTRVPVSRTYNICLSHHVLTSYYYCCVIWNNHLS